MKFKLMFKMRLHFPYQKTFLLCSEAQRKWYSRPKQNSSHKPEEVRFLAAARLQSGKVVCEVALQAVALLRLKGGL